MVAGKKTHYFLRLHRPGFLISLNLHKHFPFSFDFRGHLWPIHLILRDKSSCKGENVASLRSGSNPAIILLYSYLSE